MNEQLKREEKLDKEAKVINAEDVINVVQELYRLPFSGNVIRDFYEKQQHMRQSVNLLHTEKNVDGRGLYALIKKGVNKIMPKFMQR